MGRDDNQQSVGIFSNRLKKTPRGVGDRKLRVAEIERQFRLKQQTVNDSSKETNKVPQYSSKGMPEASTKEDLDKIPASGFVPPKTAAGETNYVTLTEAKERAKVRMVWGQTPSEDFPSPDTLTSQTPLSGFPTSSSRKFHGTAYEQPAAGAQPRTQADKARKRWAQQMDKSSTTEKVEESFWEQGPPTSDPNTERRYMLPKYKRTARPQHAAQEKPARGDKSAKFPVWLPGETYEDFAVRLRSFCDQGPRTDPEEEAQPSSTTPPDSPPSLITNQTPKFEDSETPYRAFVSSVSSTESGTAADAVHLDPFSTPDHRRNSKAQPNTKPQAKDRASGNRFRQDSRTNAAPKHGTPSDFPLSFSNRYRKYQSTEPDSLAADMRRFRVEYEKKMLGGRSTHTFTPAGEVPKSSPKRQTSPFFTILPPEIRHVIYSESLCTAKIIRGGELVEDKRTAVIIDDVRPSAMDLGIDATFLRTCWKIYREALPILYQDNWFGFSQVRMLKTFRTKGLALKGRSVTPYRAPIYSRLLPTIHFNFLTNVLLINSQVIQDNTSLRQSLTSNSSSKAACASSETCI